MRNLTCLTLLVFLAASAQNIFAAECGNPETDDVRIFRFLPPNNETWKNATPVIVEDGVTSIPMETDPEHCGWYFCCFVNTIPPRSALIYPNESRIASEAIGANGNWEQSKEATAIDLDVYFEFLGANEMYFVADEKLTDPDNIAMGWTTTDPKVDCNNTSPLYTRTNLNIINEDATALLEDNTIVGEYKIPNIIAASDTVAIYISSMPSKLEEKKFDATPAIGQTYELQITDETGGKADFASILYKTEEGKFEFLSGARTIGKTGVDTLYVTTWLPMFSRKQQSISIKVAGGSQRALSIKFVTPVLVYVDGPKSTNTLDQQPEEILSTLDGTVYKFYMIAAIQNNSNGYEICEHCNFYLAVGSMTSLGLDAVDTSYLKIRNGRAAFEVYSTKDYRRDETPASLQICGPNGSVMNADYSPLYFKKTTNKPAAITVQNITATAFRIERSGLHAFTIFTDMPHSKATTNYTVFDMLGKEVKHGEINSQATHVQLSRTGSYIVKVGTSYQQVEIR